MVIRDNLSGIDRQLPNSIAGEFPGFTKESDKQLNWAQNIKLIQTDPAALSCTPQWNPDIWNQWNDASKTPVLLVWKPDIKS